MSDRNERDAPSPEQDLGPDPEPQDTTAAGASGEGTGGEVIPAGSSGGALDAEGKVEVSAAALREAVGGLRQIVALRREESERQEQAIGAMHAAMRRQGRTNGWLVFVSLLLLAASGAGVYYFLQLQAVNEQVAGKVDHLGGELTAAQATVKAEVAATRDAVAREVGRQSETLAGIEQTLSAGWAEQAERLAAIDTELARSLGAAGDEQAAAMAAVREALETARLEQSARLDQANAAVTRSLAEVASGQSVVLSSVNDQLSALSSKQAEELDALREQLAAARAENAELTRIMDEKLRAAEQAIARQVAESVAAVRAERDQIQAEMARLLEDRMAAFAAREQELDRREQVFEAEQEQFARQAADQRERMRELLSNALQGLEPAVPATTGSPVDGAAEAEPAGQ